jgi:hypothetical protein
MHQLRQKRQQELMPKDGDQSSPEGQSKPEGKPASRSKHKKINKKWKTTLAWVGSFVSATVLAVGVAFGTGLGNSLFSTATTNHSSGPPVIIESVEPMQPWQDFSYVFPRRFVLDRSQLVAMNRQVAISQSAYTKWFLEKGAVTANQGVIDVTVAGNDSVPVSITSMQIVKHCQSPLIGGTLFYSPTTGSGPFPTVRMYFDLDDQVSVGQYLPGEDSGPNVEAGGNFFAREIVVLKLHEPATFVIFVSTQQQYCSFSFQMTVAAFGHAPVTESISDNGKPFQLTSDGENSVLSSQGISFESYKLVYAGGAANSSRGGEFIRENPATYRG